MTLDLAYAHVLASKHRLKQVLRLYLCGLCLFFADTGIAKVLFAGVRLPVEGFRCDY